MENSMMTNLKEELTDSLSELIEFLSNYKEKIMLIISLVSLRKCSLSYKV